MKLHYDSQTETLYLRLNDADIGESEEVQPGVVLDFDGQNRVVGVEILHVRRNLPDADVKRLEMQMA
jgi:uncharacterized protein YuzE